MNSTKTINQQITDHRKYLAKLDILLNKVNVAILGEEPEIRNQLEKIRLNTIDKMKEEQAIIKELYLAKMEDHSYV